MATPSIQTIINAIKTEIMSRVTPAGTLSCMVGEPNAVAIFDERPEDDKLRNYKHYQVAIYPDDTPIREESRLGGNVFREFRVGMSVFRKAAKSAQNRIFSDANDSIRGVGVYEFFNLVQDALRNNTFGGVCERRSARQFEDPSVSRVSETLSERVDFVFLCETLTPITSGAIT